MERTIKQFQKRYKCKTCKRIDIKNIIEEATTVAYRVVKKNPCRTNISRHIQKLVVTRVQNRFKCTHFTNIIEFAIEKCLIKTAKTLKSTMVASLKKGKKPATYSHYKLKIMK